MNSASVSEPACPVQQAALSTCVYACFNVVSVSVRCACSEEVLRTRATLLIYKRLPLHHEACVDVT